MRHSLISSERRQIYITLIKYEYVSVSRSMNEQGNEQSGKTAFNDLAPGSLKRYCKYNEDENCHLGDIRLHTQVEKLHKKSWRSIARRSKDWSQQRSSVISIIIIRTTSVWTIWLVTCSSIALLCSTTEFRIFAFRVGVITSLAEI